MRWVLVASLVLAAGCVASPSASVPSTNDTASSGGPPATVAPPEPALGERAATSMEHFVFLSDHTLAVQRADADVSPEAEVMNDVDATAFYQSTATEFKLTPWTTPPFPRAFETTGDIDIVVSFRSTAPAANVFPKSADFPAIGGWFGTPERFVAFIGASDAPDSIEAGKTYSTRLLFTPPQGGLFLRQGEMLALHMFSGYQTADNSPIAWVVGGLEPAGFRLPHQHFNLTAPNATTLFDGPGEIGPNPLPIGSQNQQPVDVPFKVPADALYVTIELEGTPKAGARIDADVYIRTTGGETIAESAGPGAREVIVLGPGNLAIAGRDLVAHVDGGSAPAGGSFTLRIIAYGP